MKNTLFVGGPMHGRFSPMPDDSGHVVARSDNIKDPRTGQLMQWTYYRKYLSSKPVKRRDGQKVRRHVDVFVFEGHKLEEKKIIDMLLRAVPRKMPDLIRLHYTSRMGGLTIHKRVNNKAMQFIVLDKELRDDPAKTEMVAELVRMGTSPKMGEVEVPVTEESVALFQKIYTYCQGPTT